MSQTYDIWNRISYKFFVARDISVRFGLYDKTITKKGWCSKIVANGNADGVNTVSGATCSSKAIKDACQKAFNAAKK